MDFSNPHSVVALREFLGWCVVVNFALLIFSTVMIVVFRKWVSSIHAKVFGLSESTLSQSYFDYLARFKFLVTVFNFTPWVVLHILA